MRSVVVPSVASELVSWLVRVSRSMDGSRVVLDLGAVSWCESIADLIEVCRCCQIDVAAISGFRGRLPAGLGVEVVELSADSWRVLPDISLQRIETRVRSGHSLTAWGDLEVTESIASGASVSAEGSVLVSGIVAGSVAAGLSCPSAVILCHDFRAESVSIARVYVLGRDVDERLVGRSVRISLRDGKLVFAIVASIEAERRSAVAVPVLA